MDENTITDRLPEDKRENMDSEVVCLMRVGMDSDWLRLFENTEVTIGRGLDVTYQLLSSSCPLMISRLHCTFSQREDGQWTVTDKKSLNGVWVNGIRLPAQEAHVLKLGDSIHLGVSILGYKVEYDYILVQRPLKEIIHKLAKRQKEATTAGLVANTSKRKLTVEEMEPSTSKAKLFRCSNTDKSLANPCPMPTKHQKHPQLQEPTPNPHLNGANQSCGGFGDMDNLQMYSQNILMLREQVDNTRRQVASLEGETQSANPFRGEQIKAVEEQLKTLQTKMQQMETFERSLSETRQQQEAEKTQQERELMEKQLDDGLKEQKKIIDELLLAQRMFEEILIAKNMELKETKEEKEKARAQKEEVVSQVTEVLENELQCIICSELFFEAVILNCAHSFCYYCINQWRKKKEECPICRQAIESQTRCLALDNCIDSMVENLSLDMKARRQKLILERKGERLPVVAAATVSQIQESDSESSSDESSEGTVEIPHITRSASRRILNQ
ncbi:E3 ubiquitin-protein ligase rnf8 [Stigmatopora nigra]